MNLVYKLPYLLIGGIVLFLIIGYAVKFGVKEALYEIDEQKKYLNKSNDKS